MWLISTAIFCQIIGILASDYDNCGKGQGKRGGTGATGHSTGDDGSTLKDPWSVAIVLPKEDGECTRLHCSGSILTENFVLTAAHCFVGEFPPNQDDKTIVVGANAPTDQRELKKRRRFIQKKRIKHVQLHPQYDSILLSAKFDLALVEIKGKFGFRESIYPICITDTVHDRSYHRDKGYTLLGFGKDTSVEGRDEVLTSLRLTVQPIAFCNAIYGTIIDNTFDPFNEQIKKTLPNNFNDENLICASVPGRKGGTCKGDSGGILMKNEFMGPPINDFRAVQKAVVHGSRHSCDGSRFPPIFVRLDDYDVLSWVYEVAFPGKSLAATKPGPERPIARPPPRPQRPPPQPQGPSIDPFGTSDTIQGDTVLFMQTGSSRSKAKTAEILDPSTQKAISCGIEDYPLEVEEVAAAVVGGVPMSCGGYQGGSKGTTDKCFKLQGGQWIEIGQLKQKRRRSAAAEVTINGEKALMVAGGYEENNFFKSVEIVYPDGRIEQGTEMPKPRRSHCMEKLDDTRVIIISGYEYEGGKGKKTISTLIYDSSKDTYTPGPSLKKARASMACGVFTSSLLRTQLLMVAGGSGGSNSVEYLDFKRAYDLGWQKGPDLPSASFSSGPRLTENGNKDGALITKSKNIYEMKHTLSSPGQKWVQLKPNLKISRNYNMFFSVPRAAAGC